MKFAIHPLFLSLIFLLAFGERLSAQTPDQVHSFNVTNPGNYLLASDVNHATADRDRLNTVLDITHQRNTTSGYEEFQYRFEYQLLNEAGTPQPLVLPNGSTGTTHVVTKVVGFLFTSAERLTHTVRVLPAGVLDPYQQYYLTVNVLRRPAGTFGSYEFRANASVGPRTYHHFTNTESTDPGVNVIATLNSASFARTSAVNTIPGKDAFPVNLNYSLRRWDNFDAATNTTATISLRFDVELRDQVTGDLVPLEQSSFNASDWMFGFRAVTPREPYFRTISSRQLLVKPAVQLNSVGRTYNLTVRISHVEVAGQPFVAGNAALIGATRLLHFNGTLRFGTIDTRFTSISNLPVADAVFVGYVRTRLAVDGQSGFLVGKEAYTYGDGSELTVRLLSSGIATLHTGSTILSPPEGAGPDTMANVRFNIGSVTLSTTGATSNVTVFLPAGIGWWYNFLPARAHIPFLSLGEQPLNQSLRPRQNITVNPSIPTWISDEARPLMVRTEEITWEINFGRFTFQAADVFYLNRSRLEALEQARADGLLVAESMAIKPSNEQYHRAIVGAVGNMVVTAAADGTARTDLRLSLGAGKFSPHFPQGSLIEWSGIGEIRVVGSRIDPAASYLGGILPVRVSYHQECDEDICGTDPQKVEIPFLADNQRLSFTRGGGLRASGLLQAPKELAWGYSGSTYAHRTQEFTEAGFFMPGHALDGRDNNLNIERGPAVILLGGIDPVDPQIFELPETPAYEAGLADYAGLNFRVPNNSFAGYSTLAGEPAQFLLTARSKYYVRLSGVSGIHEAQPGTFPSEMQLYGYKFAFANYGLSFLSTQNVMSRTEGAVDLPYPARFIQEFDEITFTCSGALDEAVVPEDSGEKELAYWLAKILPQTIRFVTDPADPAAPCVLPRRTLAMGVSLGVAHVDQTLFGTLGFKNDGNLVTLGDGLAVNSRFSVPGAFALAGPGQEEYTVQPTGDLYFNNYDSLPSSSEGTGFVTFPATFSVPFFMSLKTQVQTSARAGSTTAPIYLAGGWPNKGWKDGDGQHFFSVSTFDPQHRGYPAGVPIDTYRAVGGMFEEDYLVRAQQSWLGVISFDYPLFWNFTQRTFKSPSTEEVSLLVLEIQHEVKYLSPENAELVFGAQYDGLPRINLAGFAVNAIDEATGVAQAIADAAREEVRDAIAGGLDSMSDLLRDRLDKMFDELFDRLVDPAIDLFYDELVTRYKELRDQGANLEQWKAQTTTLIDDFRDEIKGLVADVVSGISVAEGLIGQIDRKIAEAQAGIAGLIDEVRLDVDGNILTELDSEAVAVRLRGLLAPDGTGERDLVRLLVAKLIEQLAPDLASTIINALAEPLSEVNNHLAALLEEVEPTIQQVVNVLEDIHNFLGEVRGKLAGPGDFLAEIKGSVNSLGSEVDAIAAAAVKGVEDFFTKVENSIQQLPLDKLENLMSPFDDYTGEEFKAMVRREFDDRFHASLIVTRIQVAIKQRLYDIDASLRAAVDSSLQEVNNVIKDLIAGTLAEVDETINGLLGDLSDIVGAGEINGYAHINGDALRLLRLDGRFQWKVPTEMEFRGYLQIKQLNSEGSPGCSFPGSGSATEIAMGAMDVSLAWISDGMRADIGTKFTIQGESPYLPLGLGGSFEMTGGALSFEAFEITHLGAAVAFGATENYISASTGLRFSDYQLAGGIFFGRTCTLEPIALWDPDVAELLGTPPFTGAYVYGEGWIPISEALLGIPASCMFNISAGVGAGAFYFIEGPTYGGKLFGGLSGEALCLVSIKGEIRMTGVKQGNDFRLSGKGSVAGRVGKCPFCVKFSKSISAKYSEGSWNVNL